MPNTTSVVVERLTQSGVNKIDLLLMVDNSASMADKQAILALAIPDLINGLVNPNCFVTGTTTPAATQPAGPLDACPAGSTRDFPPVLDIHIGLVSSSLGTFGADGCPDPSAATMCGPGKTDNDHGHLVTRSDACGANAAVTTYNNNEGFLAWDPAQALMPPGIPDVTTLVTDIGSLVTGDGQYGCGFESQNESWYRFLVDPAPYASITLNGQNAVSTGTDTTLLQQRADFLRPDSLLAIIDVTDETDVSIKEYGIYPLFAQTEVNQAAFHLPHATAACTQSAMGPNDPCCASCGESTPKGCTADPTCAAPNNVYTDATEDISIRAFGLSGGLMSHKARYGIEFMYPTTRYVNALTNTMIADNSGALHTNPIYSILPGQNPAATVRDPGLVFYAAITGVPWQLIARQDANGTPDLINGIDELTPTQMPPPGGFKSNAELNQLDKTGMHTFWDDIAGDPDTYTVPNSPFMVESTVPRTGTDPITGAPILPVTSTATPTATTAFNGHERSIATPAGDIEYACIFPLPATDYIDCSMAGAICDCPEQTTTDNPLCSPNPNDSGHPTLQTYAKAYPGVKNLAIARGMGNQGIAASICAAQVTDNTAADYGYRPAVAAIIARLKTALHGQCLPQELSYDPVTKAIDSCIVLEATKVETSSACNCATTATNARAPVPAAQQPAIVAAEQDPLFMTAQWNCFCEITQTTGAALTDCLTAPTPAASTNGWCYVDASEGAMEATIVDKCPPGEEHEIRFVGNGAPKVGATLFITCAGN